MTTTLQITHDENFLRQFRNKERVMPHTDAEVEKLRQASVQGDIYAKYAYGRWLYFANPREGAVREAEELFYNTKDDLPESEAAYAMMLRYGETETTHPATIDIDGYLQLCQHAGERGSVLAEAMMARNRIFGLYGEAEPQKVADEIEARLAGDADCDPMWYRILGLAYEELDRRDDAINMYEQAIAKGDIRGYSSLAFLYYNRGNMALYEEIMEEGCEKGCTECLFYQATMSNDDFLQLPEDEQQRLHLTIDERLRRGLALGDGFCGYMLWLNMYYGELGYSKTDIALALPYLLRGNELYDISCIKQLATIMEDETIPVPSYLRMNDSEIAELWLKLARYDNDNIEVIRKLMSVSNTPFLLKHKQELEQYWQPRLQQLEEQNANTEEETEEPETETPIEPSVLLIWPSGHLEVVETDVNQMKSFREMGEIINADGLDVVHYSMVLNQIKEAAGLNMNLAVYVDRDGYAKDLPDNMIGTILYGNVREIRGPIIVALEDQRYDCHSFTSLEDLVNTYREINKACGGLLIIKDEDDGRYDPYA